MRNELVKPVGRETEKNSKMKQFCLNKYILQEVMECDDHAQQIKKVEGFGWVEEKAMQYLT